MENEKEFLFRMVWRFAVNKQLLEIKKVEEFTVEVKSSASSCWRFFYGIMQLN